MMIKEDIPLYKLDLEGNSTFNKVDREYMFRREVKNNNIVIPPKAPFYQKTFKMFDKTGKELVKGVDYEFYGIMGKLTQFTGKPVGLFIRLLKDEILEWYVEYQVVGNFSKITNEILNMLHSIYEDDRYVIYENITNKPLWFVPEIHQHDLAFQIYGFTDLVRELGRVAKLEATMSSAQDEMVKVLIDHLNVYIEQYKVVVTGLLDSHKANLHDAHGVDKSDIGLDLVDDIRVATLEETLDGLRDDLTITPYNAGKAAEAAAGRNEKLFPSGSLPILRYGSDTFIPPTIAGSFEGMGGLTRRVGAIIETDGTLLILQHRNNGKVSGLYFTRCVNWQSQDAYYDFTAYMYTHPTATAAGANLDVVINGSNKHVMVVGDSKKNIWFWCETKGTFNPDRHVLIRISGDWVTKDMASDTSDPYQLPWDRACLLVDENYKEHFCIYQTYSMSWFKKLDPNYLSDVPNLGEYFNLICAAYSFNVISGTTGAIKRCKVDYTHPLAGNRNDDYFLPWQPKFAKKPDGRFALTSCTAVYDPPARSGWLISATQALWMSTGNPGEFAFRFEIRNSATADVTPNRSVNTGVAFRAKLTVTKVGNDTRVKVTPVEGSDKLYTIDINNQTDGVNEWSQYRKNVVTQLTPDTTPQVGSVKIAPGVMSFSGGYGNQSFPASYSIINFQYAESWVKLLTPPPDLIGGYNQYKEGAKVFTELNPVGLAAAFTSQTMTIADTDDFTTGGVMARQIVDGTSNWIFRPLGNLDSNYIQVQPTQSGVYQGVNFVNYPFTPKSYQVNMGAQVFINSMLPVQGRNNKDMYRFTMGAGPNTMLMGVKPLPASIDNPTGDCLWMQEISSKVVEGKMVITPVKVINLKAAIARDLAPIFAPSGFTTPNCVRTWTLSRALSPTGEVLSIMTVWATRIPATLIGAVVVDILESGTPDRSKGYPIFPNCTIKARSLPVTNLFFNSTSLTGATYPDLTNTSLSGGFGLSIPYRGKAGNGVPDTSAFLTMISTSVQSIVTGGSISPTAMLEITPDGKTITRIDGFQNQPSGPDNTMVPTPYYGVGQAGFGIGIFEGAATGTNPFSHTGNIFDNVKGSIYSGTPVIGISNILTPQYTVYFQKINNVLISGKMYDIPATYINILDQDPNPANKIYYIYLYYDNGKPNYAVTLNVRPEGSSQSLIARVTCGPTQIDQIIPYNRFSIDGASVSAKRQGSSILATSGSVYEIGNASAIMLNSDFLPE